MSPNPVRAPSSTSTRSSGSISAAPTASETASRIAAMVAAVRVSRAANRTFWHSLDATSGTSPSE